MFYVVHNQTDPVVESFPSPTHLLVLSCSSDNDIRDFTKGKSYLTHAPRGGGGTLIFSFIRRLGVFFSFFFFVFFFGGGGSEKKWGLTILWIFLGSSQIGLYLGVISMHLRIFS